MLFIYKTIVFIFFVFVKITAQPPELKQKKFYLLKFEKGEELLLCLSQNKIDKKEFSQNFKNVFLNKFIPRANALTEKLFPLFSPALLADIYRTIIEFFDEKIVWFYVGNTKNDLTANHINLLSKELLIYLQYLEKKNIKQEWLKNKSDTETQEIYYQLVTTAFCYQIRRVAAILLRQQITFANIITASNDPLKKASILVKKLKNSSFHEQATDILKNYEIIINNLLNQHGKTF